MKISGKTLRLLLLLPLLAAISHPAHAVLQEKNLDSTVKMLYADLSVLRDNVQKKLDNYEKKRMGYWRRMGELNKMCQEASIVLYSQEERYLFGMAQASQTMRNIYDRFMAEHNPFDHWMVSIQRETTRYQRLKEALAGLKDEDLSEEGRACRQKTIEICGMLQDTLAAYIRLLCKDDSRYEQMERQMDELESYNLKVFGQVRNRIFFFGSENYFTTLKHFPEHWKEFRDDLYDRFFTGQGATDDWAAADRMTLLWKFVILALAIGIAIGVKKKVPACCPSVSDLYVKRNYYAFVLALALIIVGFELLAFFSSQNQYMVHSIRLRCEFLLLVESIFLAVLLRVERKDIRRAVLLYLPVLVTTSILIGFRILLVSSIVVTLTAPMLFLASALLQLVLIVTLGKGLPRIDLLNGWLTLAFTVVCLVVAWTGHRFLSLFIMMYWAVLLTGMQGLFCISHLLGADKPESKSGVRSMWIAPAMNKLIYPLSVLVLLVGGVLWVAHLFNLNSWVADKMMENFIDIPEVGSISIAKICFLTALAFVFRYTIYAVKMILRSVYRERYDTGSIPVAVTIGSIIVWCIYVIVTLLMLDVNDNGIVAAIGGASMGIGFALKDTFENFFCGMSMMLGRVRLGDIVECDGIRGRITNIGISSTILETEDGAVIVFLNRQLFNKNFKNLTKNHDWAMRRVEVRIAYGNNVEKARMLMLECVQGVAGLAPNRNSMVFLNDFGDGKICLVLVVWISVHAERSTLSEIREKIYKTLAEHDITAKG